MAKYISTKTYNNIAPVAYRQWRADSHCKEIHGYGLSFHFEFECDTLDARNWCVDFGSLRPLKDKLEEWFDHKLLVASDDPEIEWYKEAHRRGIAKITEVEKTGCEGIADFLYEYVNTILLPSFGKGESERVWCSKIEVRETPSNMAMRVGHREDDEFTDNPVVTRVKSYISKEDFSKVCREILLKNMIKTGSANLDAKDYPTMYKIIPELFNETADKIDGDKSGNEF